MSILVATVISILVYAYIIFSNIEGLAARFSLGILADLLFLGAYYHLVATPSERSLIRGILLSAMKKGKNVALLTLGLQRF
jgi:hypothetical protein